MAIALPVVYVALVAGATIALFRGARRTGIVAAVAVGLGLRLIVMVVAHLFAAHHGIAGMMFDDDVGYLKEGHLSASHWAPAHLSHWAEFGFPTVVRGVFALVGPHVLAVKLVNVLAGGMTILFATRTGELVFDRRSAHLTAWVVALMPTLVWWCAPMLKEAPATMLLTASVLLWMRVLCSGRSPWAALGLLLLLAITRSSAALALLVVVAVAFAAGLGAGIRAGTIGPREAWRRVAGALAIVMLAVGLYFRGHLAGAIVGYGRVLGDIAAQNGGGHISRVPIDVIRSLASPVPWAFDHAARSWYMGLYPGIWVMYGLLPLVVVGAARIARTFEGRFVIGVIAVFLVEDAYAGGVMFRESGTVDALLAVVAVAGVTSLRRSLHYAAAAWSVAGAYATVHTGNVVVGASIGAGVAALLVAARVMPAGRRDLQLVRRPFADRSAGFELRRRWRLGPEVEPLS